MPDLTDTDKATIAALLRQTIEADRFPLSPRVRRWKAILDKLEPPAPKRDPLPPLKPPGEPSVVVDARDEAAAVKGFNLSNQRVSLT